MQAGFFRFLLAGTAAAAVWEDEPRRAAIVGIRSAADLAVTCLKYADEPFSDA